jgi:hypothetical protein
MFRIGGARTETLWYKKSSVPSGPAGRKYASSEYSSISACKIVYDLLSNVWKTRRSLKMAFQDSTQTSIADALSDNTLAEKACLIEEIIKPENRIVKPDPRTATTSDIFIYKEKLKDLRNFSPWMLYKLHYKKSTSRYGPDMKLHTRRQETDGVQRPGTSVPPPVDGKFGKPALTPGA